LRYRAILQLVPIAFMALCCSITYAMPPVPAPFHAIDVDAKVRYITLLQPKVFLKGGVPAEAIVGQIRRPQEDVKPLNFARNSVFVEFMHATIERVGPHDKELKKQARAIKNGYLTLIDRRAGPGDPSPEDVFGRFEVENGMIKEYERNEAHRILSDRGFFRLPPSIEKKLIQALSAKK
jgi:hypothetical protein